MNLLELSNVAVIQMILLLYCRVGFTCTEYHLVVVLSDGTCESDIHILSEKYVNIKSNTIENTLLHSE